MKTLRDSSIARTRTAGAVTPGVTVRSAPGVDATAVADPFGVYELMASAGPMTATDLAAYLHLHAGYVQPWLQWQVEIGYLHRDGSQRYAPYCEL